MNQKISQFGLLPWGLWCQQVTGIVRIELRKNFLCRRALWIYLLAFLPVALFGAAIYFKAPNFLARDFQSHFAMLFHGLFLRLIIFFGSVGVFTYLFRGEVLEKSLHYYFLAPLRREVLVAGKYLAGVTGMFCISATSLTICYWMLATVSRGAAGSGYLLGELPSYLGITFLACLGYGACFLLAGMLFRNPIIPTLLFLGWESVNFLLPPLLKKFSVIYHLVSLFPVPLNISAGPFAILAEPTPAWAAIGGLLLFSLGVLLLTSFSIRRMEINYSAD
jgi:hypothetical protein